MTHTPEDKEANYERVSEIVREIYSKKDVWPLVSCPCRIDEGDIVYCPIHRAAPDLLAALREADIFLTEFKDYGEAWDINKHNALRKIQQAIADVEGVEC